MADSSDKIGKIDNDGKESISQLFFNLVACTF